MLNYCSGFQISFSLYFPEVTLILISDEYSCIVIQIYNSCAPANEKFPYIVNIYSASPDLNDSEVVLTYVIKFGLRQPVLIINRNCKKIN